MCDHPLQGWRSLDRTVNGKRAITFDIKKAFVDMPLSVPCGTCDGCLKERARQWSVRMMHEASMHEANSFVTLTYDDEHLPAGGSLDVLAWRYFMDRLRKEVGYGQVRYFMCGEYGSVTRRPHYHGILFGFDFPDKALFTSRNGLPVYKSEMLSVLWPSGMSEIGSVTSASAAYVAGYTLKKIGRSGSYNGRVREFVRMSRRPGIGAEWYNKYKCEVYPADSVVVRGKLMKPPRAYDVLYEREAREDALRIRARRLARVDIDERRGSRLAARRAVREASSKLFSGERGL